MEKTSSNSKYVSLFLCPDATVAGSENLDSWPIVYHGTMVDAVQSILKHGLLMKAGDILCDGTRIEIRHGSQHSAIWTYPTQTGAESIAEAAVRDGGQTEFIVLIRVRQKPGTYTEHKDKRPVKWSTERRGTHYIEALDVCVTRAKGTHPIALMKMPSSPYVTSFSCPVQKQAFAILQLLKLPQSMFNSGHNRCYCPACFPEQWMSSMVIANETYAIPRGWTRFGLAVNPVLAHINDIWNSWQIAFHGCHPKNVLSIAMNRTLLIPHDVLPDGTKLQVWSSADPNQECYFLSPEIGYSAHPWYAKPVPFTALDGKRKYFQTVFVFKVRPGSYRKKQETEAGEMKLFDDYSIISQDEVEWFSSRRGCTHPYGLLIRTLEASDLKELNALFKLDIKSPFYQKGEFSLS